MIILKLATQALVSALVLNKRMINFVVSTIVIFE